MQTINKTTLKKRKLRKYAFEFLSIFVALISAFALNSWNDNRKDSLAESKILLEIVNGLEEDIADIEVNIKGHQSGLRSCDFWRKVFTNENPNLDSLQRHYFILTRDFISIQNVSGYETLKSKGFELLGNDSLRAAIISLYEYDYQSLRKLEEEYNEHQFQKNYFYEINKKVAPYLYFGTNGDIHGMELPIRLTQSERRTLLSYLWKIKVNRSSIVEAYNQTKENITKLTKRIDAELND